MRVETGFLRVENFQSSMCASARRVCNNRPNNVDVVVVVVVVVGCKNLATNFALEQSLSECSGDVDGVAFVDASHVPLKVLKRNDKEIFNILE